MLSPRRMSLRTQVVIASAALMVLLTGVIASAMDSRFAHRMEREIGRALVEAAHQAAVMLAQGVDFHSRQMAVAAAAVGGHPDDREAVERVLDEIIHIYPDFSWLAYLRPDGVVATATDQRMVGADLGGRLLFQAGRTAPFVGSLREGSRLGDPLERPTQMLDLAMPVSRPDGTLAGVIAANLQWEWARQIVATTAHGPGPRRGREIFLADAGGQLLLAPPYWLGANLPDHLLHLPDLGQPGGRVATWPDGGRYLTAYAGVERLGNQGAARDWLVLARQPVADAHAPVRDLIRDIWIYGLLLAFVFAALAWLAANRLSAPLSRIAGAADRIRAGEAVDLPIERGPREIASLSASLRALVDSLTDHEMRLGHMQRLAHHDTLTGLLNRAGLRDRVAGMLRKARRRGDHLACLYVDLDGFKPINDTLGHAAGDQMLREVARRLVNVLREGDEVGRLGGDEFLLLSRVQPTTGDDQARAVAERALAALNDPVVMDGKRARIGCSIGIAIWPRDSDDFAQVRQLADQALYAAKTAGRNRAHFHAPHGEPCDSRRPVVGERHP